MMQVFDRSLWRNRRDKTALSSVAGIDFLKQAANEIILESLSVIQRSFPCILDLGSHQGQLSLSLTPFAETLVRTDISHKMLAASDESPHILRVQADEEQLPFAQGSFDAVVSSLSLHTVNDIVGTLIQIYQCLKPDGLALVNFMGGETLKELRACLKQAEIEIRGGLSPRISPMIDVKDAGHLLQRAGFRLPAAVSEQLTIQYRSPFKLLQDLKDMGETNVLLEREKSFLRRDVLMRALALYTELYADPETGMVPATFEIITLTGWHDHPSQQQPLKPRHTNR